jgi:hypothetical protein
MGTKEEISNAIGALLAGTLFTSLIMIVYLIRA